MNIEQQQELKKLALKYTKSLAENGCTIELHYTFVMKHFEHEIKIYFFDNESWCFELRVEGKFNQSMTYRSRPSGNEIGFYTEMPESVIDKLFIETDSYYETWLLDLESKKNALEDKENEHIKIQIENLQKRLKERS